MNDTSQEFASPANRGKLKGQNRIRLLGIAFTAFFAAIAVQLGQLTLLHHAAAVNPELAAHEPRQPRPDIVDRNGVVMATDISVSSLYADPRKILDVDEAVESLTANIPDLDAKSLREKLKQPGRAFVWLKRQVGPEQRDAIYNLGIPGVGFVEERKRVYPEGRLGAHTVGYVDVDTKGIAGVEKFLDDQGALYTASLNEPGTHTSAPAELAMDTRVQQAVTDEVSKAIIKFKAKSGGGIILNVETGEIIALASLPDYNPNAEDKHLTSDQQNKMTSGVYELGSVIKAVTFAMALDSGTASLASHFATGAPLQIGKFRIHDLHPHASQSLEEVFTNSSNIGTAKMALAVGLDNHMEFLQRVGLLEKLVTEVPESARPLLPRHWSKLASATAAFGHGFAVQPLQGLSVIADLINGGMAVPPTFLKRSKEEAQALAHRIIKPETSDTMRYLFRANVEKGTGEKADVLGYRVGGKTGTAEKVVHGHYSKDKSLASFIGAFPMDHPKYAILVMLDEPQAIPGTYGFSTAGWNAVPTASNIIARVAPILGIEPQFSPEDLDKLAKQAKAQKKEG
ncbi:MAG: penicillin-binding protein 2 [Alphaproteobacteria bacterium]|nr:penicillin-binding protein 2 [Alphaproteobacteria bacterium]